MVLKDVHDTIEEIDEQYRDLYTEKNGKFELTGITGVKTQGDVTRVQTSLTKERADHKATKEKLQVWGDLDHAATLVSLDRIPELEAASKGKLDEAKIEEIVTRRVEGTINSRIAPLERRIKEQDESITGLTDTNGKLTSADNTRKIHDHVRKALTKAKVLPGAFEDALILADRHFEIREDDGAIVTRDNIGITPGLGGEDWLGERQDSRRHWWGESVGGGSKGSGKGGSSFGGDNPWGGDTWNATKQGQFVKEHGMEKSEQRAKAAGTTVGGPRPTPKK